jgi:hypothetical protein
MKPRKVLLKKRFSSNRKKYLMNKEECMYVMFIHDGTSKPPRLAMEMEPHDIVCRTCVRKSVFLHVLPNKPTQTSDGNGAC